MYLFVFVFYNILFDFKNIKHKSLWTSKNVLYNNIYLQKRIISILYLNRYIKNKLSYNELKKPTIHYKVLSEHFYEFKFILD